ncbi:MAG: hypothetical protein WC455_16715 [Dehalococcoidia bacterium]|jgi:hypothetical protein
MSDVYRELVEKNYDAYIKTIEKSAALCLYLGIDAASAKGVMVEKTFIEHVLSIS